MTRDLSHEEERKLPVERERGRKRKKRNDEGEEKVSGGGTRMPSVAAAGDGSNSTLLIRGRAEVSCIHRWREDEEDAAGESEQFSWC